MHSDPHADCLQAIACEDKDAMRRFYETYADIVYSFALRRLSQPAEAADLLHEVMLEVWRKAGNYQGRSRVRTWLLGIAHHKILDRQRVIGRARQREDDDADAEQTPSAGISPLAAVVGASDAHWIRHCLDKLGAIHQQVMHLTFFQELSCAEIAEVLNCPVGTVKTRMMHARRQMKACLQAVGVSAPSSEVES